MRIEIKDQIGQIVYSKSFTIKKNATIETWVISQIILFIEFVFSIVNHED